MSELVTNLASDDKRYLGLLARLMKTFAPHHKVSESGIAALVNIDGSQFHDEDKEKVIKQFVPPSWKRMMESDFARMHNELKRAEAALNTILDFKPSGQFDNPYQELIYNLTWHPDIYKDVELKYFKPEYMHLFMAFNFMNEPPEKVNMLDQNRALSISNMYFAALQRLQGFPPSRNDRATENMFNMLFLEGKSVEDFKMLIEESRKDEKEGDGGKKTGLEFLVRLESEYIKAMMFYGSIEQSGMTTIDFLKELHSQFMNNQQDLRFAAQRGFSGDVHYNNIEGYIMKDLIGFIGHLAPENMGRFFHAFGATRYEDIIELFIKTVPEYPKLLALNRTHFTKDQQYARLARFIVNSTDAIKETGRQDSLLLAVQNNIIDNFTICNSIMNSDEDNSKHLFAALKDVSYDIYERNHGLRERSEAGFFLSNIFREKSIPLIQSIFNERDSKIADVARNLPEAFKDRHFNDCFSEYVQAVPNSYDLLLFFANFSKDLQSLRQSISGKEVTMSQADESISTISKRRIYPTANLITRLAKHEGEKDGLVSTWENLLASRFNSAFDRKDELHRNLGYTQFSSLLDNAHLKNKMNENLKLKWSFDSYLDFLRQENNNPERSFHYDDFEIECAAFESSVLFDFLLKQSSGSRRPTLVVPNLRSGYIPAIPIYEDILDKGMQVYLDAKVGSSYTHDNPAFFDSTIFSSIEESLLEEQPDILVIDATKHMVSDDGKLPARYPDAYQGYLNYAIALNEISGTPLTHISRSDEDLHNLKNKHEFIEFVEKYREDYSCNKPYSFEFWNTAGLPLVIRKDREKISIPPLYQPGQSRGPTIIFCNVGMTDDQIPAHIKNKYPGLIHVPAHFDDSESIISLELRVCNEGIVLYNQIETLLKKAYSQYNGRKAGMTSNFSASAFPAK
jgi:hypothetical protein